MELPATLDPRALTTVLTKFTGTSAVTNRELAAAVHHLAGYFAGIVIKDGSDLPVFLGVSDGAEDNLLLAIAELEKDGSFEVKGGMIAPAGNPALTALLLKFAMLALAKWIENQAK